MIFIKSILWIWGITAVVCIAWILLVHIVCLFARNEVEGIIKIPVGAKVSARGRMASYLADEHNQHRQQFSVYKIKKVLDDDAFLANALKCRMMMHECKQAAEKAHRKNDADAEAENQKLALEYRIALAYTLDKYLQALDTMDN